MESVSVAISIVSNSISTPSLQFVLDPPLDRILRLVNSILIV